MVIQMFYLQGRKKELNIYLPEREHEFPKILEMFYTFQERLTSTTVIKMPTITGVWFL
jgi:hypothetical protein